MDKILCLENPKEVFDKCWHEAKSDRVAGLPCSDPYGQKVLMDDIQWAPLETLFHFIVNPQRAAVRKCLGIITAMGPVVILENVLNPDASYSQLKYKYSLEAPQELLKGVGDSSNLSGAEIYKLRPAQVTVDTKLMAQQNGLRTGR